MEQVSKSDKQAGGYLASDRLGGCGASVWLELAGWWVSGILLAGWLWSRYLALVLTFPSLSPLDHIMTVPLSA